VCISDSLETILSHLSARVTNVITNEDCLQDLYYFLEFLAAWKERPVCLAPMTYEWCSAISEAAGNFEWSDRTGMHEDMLQVRNRLQHPAFGGHSDKLRAAEMLFSEVGRHCEPLRSDDTSRHTRGRRQDLTPGDFLDLLPIILEIGFRLVAPGSTQPTLNLDHTPHHNRMFEAVFSSNNDELTADAVSVWVVSRDRAPPGLCARYLTKRLEWDTPFSPRLRWMSIQAIERIWLLQHEMPGLGTVRLLNRLNVDVDDVMEKDVWVEALIGAICLPAGVESLSSHSWRLLDKLESGKKHRWTPGSRNVEVMRSLEEAEDWEKLEVWMVVVWLSLSGGEPMSTVKNIEQVTLKLLLQRASALPRFKTLSNRNVLDSWYISELRGVCSQAQAKQLPSESPPPPYVSVPSQYLSILMSPFCFALVD
jgi:hypothetical protein